MERDYKPGDEPVPRFVLRRKLGKGAFGEVWMAASRGGVNVALKIISLENKSGLKEFRAIRTVKNVHHPNLVPIIDIWLRDANGDVIDEGGEADSVVIREKAAELIIAMGLCEKSLLERLKECQKQGRPGIPADELIHYMENSARAIDYLNFPQSDSERAAIQHCDIKPGNIMVVGGSAQVCDFGLARVLGGDVRATRSGDHMSVPYTSPELFWDASKPSQWSDQYSLAISYVELRTGSLPFEQVTPAGMMFAHTQGKLDYSKLTPREQTIIRRATSVDAPKRYPTTMEMVQELRRANDRTSRMTFSGPITTQALEPGTEIVPGYRLVRRIGQGGYGTVWEARAPGGRPAALKLIFNLEAGTGRQEFKALELIKSLDHPHLLELHAYWLLDNDGNVIPDEVWNEPDAPNADTLVIATKLAQMNLQQRLRECQDEGSAGIPSEELIGYMRQTALAIDYLNEPKHPLDAHLVSIQHRDIKPENILLVKGGTVQVGDFGLARVLEGESGQVRRESRAFTPPYAAPELYTDKVTRWTDQYALALTYYKLRTGVLPFSENLGRTEIMMTHVDGKLDLSRLPETEKAVIARAVSKQSEQRFPTCLAMVDALDRALKADFPVAQSDPKPLFLMREEHHRHHTTPYNPSFESDAPFAKSVITPAKPSTHKSKPDDDICPTVSPEGVGFAVTNTPVVQGNATDTAPEERPVSSPVSPSVKRWKDDASPEAPKPRGSGMKYVVGAMLCVAVGASGYFVRKPVVQFVSAIFNPTSPPTSPVPTPPTFPTPPTDPGPKLSATAELAAEIDSNLSNAERLLAAGDIAGAADAFAVAERLSRDHSLKDKWNQIIFGKARGLGRQSDWAKLKSALDELADLKDADKLHRDFLVRLAGTKGNAVTPVGADDLALLQRLDGAEKLLDPWEEQEHQLLRTKVDEVVWNQITVEFAKVPAETDRSKLEAAFDQATKLAETIEARKEIVKNEQDKVIEGLWKAAKGKRSETDDPFKPFESSADAARASQLLETVASLLNRTSPRRELTSKQKQELGLALLHGAEDERTVYKSVRTLLDGCKFSDDVSCVPYLMAKAASEPSNFEGWKTRFELYDGIYHHLVKYREGKHVEDRYEKVLEPALRNGMRAEPEGDAEFTKRLGQAFYAKAKFFDKYTGGTPVRDWRLERMKAAEEAVKRWPDPDALMNLCDWHVDWANRDGPKRDYLVKAAQDAKNAAKVGAGVDFQRKARSTEGSIYEDLGMNFDADYFEKAIEAYSAVHALNGSDGKTLVLRGRCLSRHATSLVKLEQREKATAERVRACKDLSSALRGELNKEDKLEAGFWLGKTRADNEEFQRAQEELVRCLDSAKVDFKGSFNKLVASALASLLDVGESLFRKSSGRDLTPEDREPLEIAVTCYAYLNTHIRDFGVDHVKAMEWTSGRVPTHLNGVANLDWIQIFVNGRIRLIGEAYEKDPAAKDVKKALSIYAKGVPEKIEKATIGNVLCLNSRNSVLALKWDQLGKPSLDELINDAKLAIKLLGKHPMIEDRFRSEAHVAASKFYMLRSKTRDGDLAKEDKKNALDHIDQALGLPGLDPPSKDVLRTLKKNIQPSP